MRAKVFFTAVAQPNSELLGNFFFLGFGELVVEREGFFSFSPAGRIAVGIPQSFGGSNSTAGFFDKGLAF